MEKRNIKNSKNKYKNNYIQRTPQNKNVVLYSSENVNIINLNKKINNTVEINLKLIQNSHLLNQILKRMILY
jgi:hypothetical protein